jgi:hypothetical protein
MQQECVYKQNVKYSESVQSTQMSYVYNVMGRKNVRSFVHP